MPPPVLRKRNSSAFTMSKGDIEAKQKEKEKELGFSDDEDSIIGIPKDEGRLIDDYASKPHYTNASTSNIPSDITGDALTQVNFSAEAEEVEGDVEMFNKAIHISNIEQVDHADLLRRMHKRFKKKVKKWEYMAYKFAWYAFMMSFAILFIQVIQMIIHQFTGFWISERSSVTAQGIMSAMTALVAGLQLKLKFNEKAERYRRGAKVYGRLLRISTYYLMMLESGGKIEDVTGLWREAMKKEGKWIPLVRTYMPL